MGRRAEVVRLNEVVLPRYCTAELSRHDRICVYYRKVGVTRRVRIREEPGTPAFYATYAALLGGAVPRDSPRRSQAQPATWRWLCEQYFQSLRFRTLACEGQSIRRRALESTYEEPVKPGSQLVFRDCPVEKLKAQAIRILRDRKLKWDVDAAGQMRPTNVEAANSRLKYIRGVLAFAKEEFPHLVERNWAADVDYLKSSSEGFHTWTLEEIAQFEERHPIGTKARLALALGLFTGQRRGDAVRLGRSMERKGMLEVVQEKNSRHAPVTAWVPIVPSLKAILNASPTGDLFYLVQSNGQPYEKESFGNLFREWCDLAGLPHCSFHGLRKACVVRLIMDDCTPHQIMAVTGHQTLKEIDRYARRYMRERAAIEVLERWRAKHTTL